METCKWLVANRSRLDEEDDFNRTPVDMAENNGHDDVALFLRTCINELKQRTSLESLLSGLVDQSKAVLLYHLFLTRSEFMTLFVHKLTQV